MCSRPSLPGGSSPPTQSQPEDGLLCCRALGPHAWPRAQGGAEPERDAVAPRAVTAWGAGPALRDHRLLIAKFRILMKRMFHCFSSVSVHGLSSHAEPVALSEIKQPVGVWGVVCALEQGLPGSETTNCSCFYWLVLTR